MNIPTAYAMNTVNTLHTKQGWSKYILKDVTNYRLLRLIAAPTESNVQHLFRIGY